ncbi:MAG TPA: hypothetical protein VMN35_07710 [Gaiellaceae bacterium]|nr:hypothetical protein [Gaiellaceae bacterium]
MEELLGIAALQDHALGPGFDHCLVQPRFGRRGDHKHGDVPAGTSDLANDVRGTDVGKPVVDEEEIRAPPIEQTERFVSGLRLADDTELGSSERDPYPGADDRIVVDERNAPGHLGASLTPSPVTHPLLAATASATPLLDKCCLVSVVVPSEDTSSAREPETRPGDTLASPAAESPCRMQQLVHVNGARLDEDGTVLTWRVWVLDRAGYEGDAAVALAIASDVDLHEAVDLVENGCPPETALRILL